MKVRATGEYEKKNLLDNELGRIPKAGEEFEVSKERYEVLTKTNKFNAVFVEKVEKAEDVETAIRKDKIETAVKKIRKKVKSIELDLDKGTVKTN